MFDVPVADDICSDFQVNMTSTYQDGLCPLSVVLTRTFTATDQCGNTSAPFVQTITESTDLTAELDFTAVSCHDGSDGTAFVSYEGGVAPYTVDWGGYDPENLAAGEYSVEVNDANLCNVEMDFIITEPAPFTMTLAATTQSARMLTAGPWSRMSMAALEKSPSIGVEVIPNSLSAGTYEVVATDELGCQAMATGVVPSADIPEPLELTGDANVVQETARLTIMSTPLEATTIGRFPERPKRCSRVCYLTSLGQPRHASGVCHGNQPRRLRWRSCLHGCVRSR